MEPPPSDPPRATTVAVTPATARPAADTLSPGNALGLSAKAEDDRAVLMALYEATDGPNWVNNEGWLSDAPLGAWHGVEVDGTGRVVRLRLSHNGLSGAIPPELGELAALLVVAAVGNDLSGPIPSELGDLASLRGLYLGSNSLSGSIPPELGKLAALSRLDLVENNLSGPIPPELGNLASLRHLDLGSNGLSGSIPSELGNLANLTGLLVEYNNLSGPLPASLRQLRQLEQFHWHNTNLCVPPDRTLRAWLRSLQRQTGTGVNCSSSQESNWVAWKPERLC